MNCFPASCSARRWRWLPAFLLVLVAPLAAVENDDDEIIAPPLGPILRPPLLEPQREAQSEERRPQERARSEELDAQGVAADLKALDHAVELIRQALREEHGIALTGEAPAERQSAAIAGRLRQPVGKPAISSRLGANHLAVLAYDDGSKDVDARITDERIKRVYGELTYLLGFRHDDQGVGDTNRKVDVHIEGMPWRDAVTRILGQAGLGWELVDDDGEQVVRIYRIAAHPMQNDTLARLAQDALRKAAAGAVPSAAAEAMFRDAQRDLRLGDFRNAQEGFITVIDRFQDEAANDLGVRQWVLNAYLGLADARMAQDRFRDARRVYRSYISSPLVDEAALPEVYRRAAEASQMLGRETDDQKDFQQAMALLDEMLNRFGNKPSAHQEVVKARFTLGVLLLDQGLNKAQRGLYQDARNDFRAAKSHFIAFRGIDGNDDGSDLLRSYLAKCDLHLALARREVGEFEAADKLLASAQTYYRDLIQAWETGDSDPEVDKEVYKEAYFQNGECWMLRQDPQFVRALFAYLQARKAFPHSELEGKTLIRIAQCYAELESDRQAIATFNDLLVAESDGEVDVEQELDELIGSVLSGLSDYDAPVQARVHFYIAQAHYRAAERGGPDAARHLEAAMQKYQRVLNVLQGDREHLLYYAAQIGLARSALRAGDEPRGEQILTSLLRDPKLSGRDRQYAAQLLGRYYKDQGRYEKAIQAYSGMGVE